jgi:hypothetical protein
VSVSVQLIGRLGNNLFQYALGRILATRLGLALTCEQLPWVSHEFLGMRMDHRADATLTSFLPYFPNVRLALAGRSVDAPVTAYEFRSFEEWDGQTIGFEELLRGGDRHIVLRGFFQRMEYYERDAARIREWYQFLPAETPHAIGPDDVVVNVRRGLDMAMMDWVVAPSFYRDVLAAMPNVGRVFVCGTGIDDAIRTALADYDPVYYSGTPYEHFSFLMRFPRMVMSNSTFCWWAAFLSDASELHAPAPAGGYGFSTFPGVDLRIPGSRYREWPAATEPFRPFVLDPDRAAETAAQIPRSRASFRDWLLAQREPLSARELYGRYFETTVRQRDGEAELEETLRNLVAVGALKIHGASR